jgi:alpha-1,6-mannosyltransferase
VLLVPFGVYLEPRRAFRLLLAPALFVASYSALAHKELRFVIYVVPPLTAIAAVAAARLWSYASDQRRRATTTIRLVAALLLATVVGACVATTLLGSLASHANYPGGVALRDLHQRLQDVRNVTLHIDVAAAQSGVSRFGERRRADGWLYSKLEQRPLDTSRYSHLLAEATAVDGFRPIAVYSRFERLDWRALSTLDLRSLVRRHAYLRLFERAHAKS